MNPNVLRRFITYMIVLMFVGGLVAILVHEQTGRAPGDYYTEVGGMRLQDKLYKEALVEFNKALKESPNHRGALMGRALVFIQTKQDDKAIVELTYLAKYLTKTLDPKKKPIDATGFATLAATYANRGIVHDRNGRHRKALDDYKRALLIDEDTLSGPDVMHRIIYGNVQKQTVRKRALYIQKQLKLPPEKRVLRIPEIDKKQRMYKP